MQQGSRRRRRGGRTAREGHGALAGTPVARCGEINFERQRRVLHALCIDTATLSSVFPFITLIHFVAAWRVGEQPIIILRSSFLALSLLLLCFVRVTRKGSYIFASFAFLLAGYRAFGEQLIALFLDMERMDNASGTLRDYWFLALVGTMTGLPLWLLVLLELLLCTGCLIEFYFQSRFSAGPTDLPEIFFIPVYIHTAGLVYYSVVCVGVAICRVRSRPLRVLLDLPISFFKSYEPQSLHNLLPSTLEKHGFTREEHLALMLRLTDHPLPRVLSLSILSEQLTLTYKDNSLSPLEEFSSRARLKTRKLALRAMLRHFITYVSSPALRPLLGMVNGLGGTFATAEDNEDKQRERRHTQQAFASETGAAESAGLFPLITARLRTLRRAVVGRRVPHLRRRRAIVNHISDLPAVATAPAALKLPKDLEEVIPKFIACRRELQSALAASDPLMAMPQGVLQLKNDSDLTLRLQALPTFTARLSDLRNAGGGASAAVRKDPSDGLGTVPSSRFYANKETRLSITKVAYNRYLEAIMFLRSQTDDELENQRSRRANQLRKLRGDLRPHARGPPPPTSSLDGILNFRRLLGFLRTVQVALEGAAWDATVMTPHRSTIGTFVDLKIERWYLAWSTVVRARIHVTLARPVLYFGVVSRTMLSASFVANYLQSSQLGMAMSTYALPTVLVWCGTSSLVYIAVLGLYAQMQVKHELQGPLTAHQFHRRAVAIAALTTLLSCADLVIHSFVFLGRAVDYHIIITTVLPIPLTMHLGRRLCVQLAVLISLFIVFSCLVLQREKQTWAVLLVEAALFVLFLGGSVFALGSVMDENFRCLFSRFLLPYLLYLDSLHSGDSDQLVFESVERQISSNLKDRKVRFHQSRAYSWEDWNAGSDAVGDSSEEEDEGCGGGSAHAGELTPQSLCAHGELCEAAEEEALVEVRDAVKFSDDT